MVRPAKRRQVDTVTSQSISSFGRVSKGNAALSVPGKKSLVAETPSPRKRKASSLDDEENDNRLAPRTVSFPPSDDDEDEAAAPSKRACRRQQEPSLVHPTPAPLSPKPNVTKGKRTAPAPSSRAHKASDSTIIAKSRQSTKTIQTKIDASFKKQKSAVHDATADLPPHLAELVHLHKAFVNAAMIQIAHSGINVPLDIQALRQSISLSWKKRQVTVDDIRRCVAIQTSTQNGSVSPFIVSDYGRGKICVELAPHHDGSPLAEDKLCAQFQENLRHLCTQHTADAMADVDISLEGLSLGDLPQADIANRNLGLDVNPVLAKGHRALTELRNDVMAKQQARQQAATSNPVLNPDGTKMSLLDRLRHKQLARENAPLPPSGPELERRAALNRVADVSATLSMLSLSKPASLPRQAFPMQAVLDSLKDSLRVPISKEEATSCVRLIATEVAPEWLRVVALGGRENVVIQRNQQPVDRVIRERVAKMMG